MQAFVPSVTLVARTQSSASITTRASRFVGRYMAIRTLSTVRPPTTSMQMDDEEPMAYGMDNEREAPQELEEAKLFIGNLSWGSTDDSLAAAFDEFGDVIDSKVVTDRFTGKSRGFGFITFAEAESADKAMENLNGAEVDGRPIRIDRANKRPGGGGPRKYNNNGGGGGGYGGGGGGGGYGGGGNGGGGGGGY